MPDKTKRDFVASYGSGSWNTYSLEEYSGPDFITAGTIARAMRVFERQFKMNMDVVSGSQLLFWTLVLEERRDTPATRSRARLRRKILTQTFRFAISSDDNLLFCNKMISANMQRQLSRALSCNGLKIMKLRGSDPVNLLMMYKQSKRQSPNVLKLMHEEHMYSLLEKVQHHGLMNGEDLTQEITEAESSKVFQSMGSQSDTIPCLRRVDISIRNMPPQDASSLPNFRWTYIEAEVFAPSVFHLYREAGMLKIIDNAPEWLKKIRISGKTEAEARFV
ncbi:hypothetical protein O3P69_011376 [Scylla paramamosain]|uniref:Uncharacterized protein n=1 Tax=Scylla paramamosain TaxID=85552 RepID=A0AAW0T563_SCYPA